MYISLMACGVPSLEREESRVAQDAIYLLLNIMIGQILELHKFYPLPLCCEIVFEVTSLLLLSVNRPKHAFVQ